MSFVNQYVRLSLRWMDGLSSDQWLYLGVGVFLLGIVCLRGFGSRTNY